MQAQEDRFFSPSSTTQNNIFYSLGSPIRITNQRCSGLSLFIYRKDYQVRELYQSFTEKNITILLFKTEHEALAYSRFLQVKPEVDSGFEAFQRPVFKVEFKGNTENLSYQDKHLTINEFFLIPDDPFLDPISTKSQKLVRYCEVNANDVKPIYASLYVHDILDTDGFDKAGYNTPLILDYTADLESQLEISRPSCVLF